MSAAAASAAPRRVLWGREQPAKGRPAQGPAGPGRVGPGGGPGGRIVAAHAAVRGDWRRRSTRRPGLGGRRRTSPPARAAAGRWSCPAAPRFGGCRPRRGGCGGAGSRDTESLFRRPTTRAGRCLRDWRRLYRRSGAPRRLAVQAPTGSRKNERCAMRTGHAQGAREG